MVTTTEALSILEGRGLNVPYTTLARWLEKGLVAGAERDDSHPRGVVWRIPADVLEKFQPPKRGRPSTKKGGKA